MGNCFAGCFQRKESSSAVSSDEKLSETSSNESAGGLSTYIKTKNGEATRKKHVVKKKESSVVTRKAWTRNRNRVAPCSNGTASGTRRVKTFQGRKHFPLSVSSSSGSSDSAIISSSSESFETDNNFSYGSESYQESSSRSSYSDSVSSTTYDDSSSHSACSQSVEIKPGVTQGRLIIVQPCRSLSESQESSSTESVHSEYTSRTTESASDSSSSSSCSRDKGYSDDSSDEEFCKVHPY